MKGCCKHCTERKVTESYNCHSHCEKYLEETIVNEKEKHKIRKEKEKEKQVTAVLIDGYRRKRGKR